MDKGKERSPVRTEKYPPELRAGMPHLGKPMSARSHRISANFADHLDWGISDLREELCHTRKGIPRVIFEN